MSLNYGQNSVGLVTAEKVLIDTPLTLASGPVPQVEISTCDQRPGQVRLGGLDGVRHRAAQSRANG